MTTGAYSTVYSGGTYGYCAFASRLELGCGLFADTHELTHRTAGIQNLTVCAGAANAKRGYRLFGSVSGTRPGAALPGIVVPLNPDPYTDFTIANPTSPLFAGFAGTLDAMGVAHARFLVPKGLPPLPDFTVHHAALVFGASGAFYFASEAVPLRLRN